MEKKQVYLYSLLVIALLGIYFLQMSYTAYQVKSYNGNVFGSGAYDILDLYYAYPNWIDFLLFLVLFIGVGMYAFGDRFQGAGKSVYVVIGIILALGIVIWETRTGFYFLEYVGPYAFLLVSILAAIMVWKWISDSTGSGALGVAIALLIFFLFFWIVNSFTGSGYLIFDFLYSSPFFAFLIGIAPLIIIVLIIVGIIAMIKRGRSG